MSVAADVGGKARQRYRRDDRATSVTAAAIRIIEDYGVTGLSFRALANDSRLGVSRGTPLYIFGTTAGLLAAVAADVFHELAERLKPEANVRAPSVRMLERMARQHVTFALERPNLYQAIHSPELWTATTADYKPNPGRQKPPGKAAQEKARHWIEQAVAARNSAFTEYETAVKALIAAGRIRRSSNSARVARMVTALIDGYLFQLFHEQVGVEGTRAEQIDFALGLVRLALKGVAAS